MVGNLLQYDYRKCIEVFIKYHSLHEYINKTI